MSEYKYIKTRVEDGVGIIQIDHLEKRNALGWDLHREIPAVLDRWIEDDSVACVLFMGNEEIFCGGWDLDVLNSAGPEVLTKFNDLALKFMQAIYDYGKPTVCAVAGMAPGYGMDVANMCDVTVASQNAKFASTQVKYAMNGFYGGMQRKCGPMRARRLYFTGDAISAEEAYRIGLIDELVPVGQLLASALDLAKRIARHGSEMSTVLKRVALRAQNMDHIGGLAFELHVTHDLLHRGIFQERIQKGFASLKAGQSVATERFLK
ncbi:MAG TPA: enoyl-CoA hydratase/isomerase family protein [Vicinamibacterales bacterium]|nr:enoyl-CoA hydratase/isomerase family protein [Vicinamibacterales bacterium]